ncbi:hypothetical protein [Clostridium manihotivorum]|uniref:hypothetical protein n=1 Tax=Clostridium manihotivorum TaxID=2320868 RepID=UPI00196AA0DA|nr:hypothetical protein [Clostridium manihotivorum]
MKISKKDDILKLYEEGFNIEEIVEKGYGKKYVKQVLKKAILCEPIPEENLPLCPEPELESGIPESINSNISNQEAIDQIKEILQLLEDAETNSVNIDISISIQKKVQKHENTEVIASASTNDIDLVDSKDKCICDLKEKSSSSPIDELKSLDKEDLEKKLNALKQKELIELIKSSSFDISESLYKKRSKKTLISYIIEKLPSL